jgi:hypothetical protein
MTAMAIVKKAVAAGLILWALMVQPLTVLANENPRADGVVAAIQVEATAVPFDGRLLTARDLQTEQVTSNESVTEPAAAKSDPEWKYLPVRR